MIFIFAMETKKTSAQLRIEVNTLREEKEKIKKKIPYLQIASKKAINTLDDLNNKKTELTKEQIEEIEHIIEEENALGRMFKMAELWLSLKTQLDNLSNQIDEKLQELQHTIDEESKAKKKVEKK